MPDFFASSFWPGAASLWFLVLSWKTWRFRRHIGFLRDVKLDGISDWPRVSLVVPACNEADTVEAAAKTLLAIDYPNFEVVIVDDRSTDGTSEVLARLSDPRLKIIRIDELPEGWLGKVHALDVGARAATGEWLLFTDADVHHRNDSLKKAIRYCCVHRLDFLAVGPQIISHSWLLSAFIFQFLHIVSLLYHRERSRDPRYHDAYGAGAYNLVKRSALERSQAFSSIKMEVLDDICLAWIVKRTGGRLDFLSGLDEIKIEWYRDLPGFVRGLEKNGFAPFEYSLRWLLLFLFGNFGIFAATLVAPLFAESKIALTIYFVALAVYLAASGLTLKKVMGLSPWIALSLPVTFIGLPLVFLRAGWICARQGGIRWRGTLYRLEDLRREQRLRPIQFQMDRFRS